MIFGIDRAGQSRGRRRRRAASPSSSSSFNHSGAADAVERDTAGLRRGPKPVSDTVGSQPYLEVQTAHDLLLGWGGRSFIKGWNADVVRPEALDAIVDHVAAAPGGGLLGHRPGRRDRPGRRGRDGVRRSGRAVRPQRRHELDTTPRSTTPTAPGSGGPWRSSSPTPSRAATRTRTPTPAPTRRGPSTATPSSPGSPPQADLGPGQRLPAEPQRRAVGGALTDPFCARR